MTQFRIRNEWGFILLAIFLIGYALVSLIPALSPLSPVVAIVALVAAIFILIGR